MSPLMMRFFTLVGVALMAASMQLKARAETLAGADAQQVQTVVQARFRAFAEGDAEAAFATATPGVRKSIGQAARFLALLQDTSPCQST